jgi:hypothetical protein
MTPPLPDITDAPATRAALVAALERVHRESVAYWQSFPTPAFFAPLGTAWAPADHVRHLTKSMRAVTAGLRWPRLVIRLAFGRPRRPSRAYDVLRDDYRAALARGGQAGKYAPSPLATTPERSADDARAQIMAYHATAVDALRAAADRWSDEALDRHQLPHPLLGPLTIREMLAFTLYHNLHHVHVADRRRREAAEVAAQPTPHRRTPA